MNHAGTAATEQSEEALLRQVNEGDRSALGVLLERHRDLIRRRLGRMIPLRFRRILSADDVFQSACADALRAVQRFAWRRDGCFGAWLITVARHSLLNAVKRLDRAKRGGSRHPRVRSPRRGVEPRRPRRRRGAARAPTSPERPDEPVVELDGRELLVRCYGELSPQHQQVIRLCDIDRLPMSAIAAALNRTPGAVHMLRTRAHLALRRMLEAGGVRTRITPPASFPPRRPSSRGRARP